MESVPYKDYVGMMRSSHVILDQLYSYTPATNAMLAMAQGIVAVTGAEPEFYDFIGEHDNRPIINAVPDDEALFRTFEDIVLHPERIPAQSRASRDFVATHNHLDVVSRRFLDFWAKGLSKPRSPIFVNAVPSRRMIYACNGICILSASTLTSGHTMCQDVGSAGMR